MATVPPTPSHGDPAPHLPWRPPPPSNGMNDARWQPPFDDPDRAESPRTASGPYTATDAGAGVSSDSLQAWQSRAEFGTFVRADVAGVAASAAPSYYGQPAALVAPSLVLTDDTGPDGWP